MMINCKESAIRSSELRDQHIKGVRKLELWFHLFICKFCRIYDRQMRKMGRFSRLMGDISCGECGCDEQMPDVKLTEEAKERIKRRIVTG